MKKLFALMLALVMLATMATSALAVNEDIEGKITIYTSMYRFVYEGMKVELAKEFPNLDVEFYYAGTGTLISQIANFWIQLRFHVASTISGITEKLISHPTRTTHITPPSCWYTSRRIPMLNERGKNLSSFFLPPRMPPVVKNDVME